MAETALSSFAGFVLKKLGSVAVVQAGLLWGLESEISKLKKTVSSIQAVLQDAEEQSKHSHQIQLWLSQLKLVLYDADDIFDDLSTEALRRQQMNGNQILNEVGLFFSDSNQLAYSLKVANQIKAIRGELEGIDENRKQFNFQPRVVDPTAAAADKKWRQTDESVPLVFIGREEEKQQIVDMLMLAPGGDGNVAVVPIIGMGGLGKTALAQSIYNDNAVNSGFSLKIWLSVSDKFEENLLIKMMWEHVSGKEAKDAGLVAVKKELRQVMDKQKFLIVLDDVWDDVDYVSNWDRLKDFLWSVAAVGSRIIVTTRITSIAELMATSRIRPHELQGLPHQQSWALFQQIALEGKEIKEDERYLKIGEEILTKCVGVPLMIRAMAGLLSCNENVEDWTEIRDKQRLLDADDRDGIVLATLRLSYDNLPSHLKRCFAYCSLFPKCYVIHVKTLIQLWSAQGYIESGSENVGAKHFSSLLRRSFFQEVMKDKWGTTQTCKMHDLMHDLAVVISGDENIIFNASKPLGGSRYHRGGSSSGINHAKLLHASFYFGEKYSEGIWQVPACLEQPTKLRTFLSTKPDWGSSKMRPRECEIIIANMARLRALSLDAVGLQIVPATIHKLKLLRYLDLSRNEMEMLPNSISRLANLGVLMLDGCTLLRRLPGDIVKLYNLSYLGLDGCEVLTCIPVGIGELSGMRELSLFVVGESVDREAARISELKHLNNLSGKLRIEGLESLKDEFEAESASLKQKQHVRILELVWRSSKSPAADERTLKALQPHENVKKLELSGYAGMNLPRWFASLKSMVRLKLHECGGLLSLPSLYPLVSLEELSLESLHSLEYVQSETTTPPPPSSSSCSNDHQLLLSLKSLAIHGCSNLIAWSSAKTTEVSQLLPCLSTLDISGCGKLVWSSSSYCKVDTENSVAAAGDERTALHPDENLKKLEMSTNVPSWFTSLEKVVLLNLHDCGGSRSLPSLYSLVFLEKLTLDGLHSLEYIQSEAIPSSSSSCGNNSRLLHSLKSLLIRSCPNLIGWSSASTTTGAPRLLSHLSNLNICMCPKMVSLPRLSAHVEYVGFVDAHGELLSALAAALPPPSSPSLSRFKSLELERMEGLKLLPQELLPHLTSLESLKILDCQSLTTLFPAIQHLASLKELDISNCKELSLEEEDDDQHLKILPQELVTWLTSLDYLSRSDRRILTSHFPAIQHLASVKEHISDCKELKLDDDGDEDKDQLNTVLCGLPSLLSLSMNKLPGLLTLPAWLQRCSKLQKLHISYCPLLLRLPSWMMELTALQSLQVNRCPFLSARWRISTIVWGIRRTADEWPSIAHVADIQFDNRMIQLKGHYLLTGEEEELDARERPLNRIITLTCDLFQICFAG